jgi:hypothetical protein
MSKYSVGGTEVISDAGTIDWSKIKNHPLPSNVKSWSVSVTNCGTGGSIAATITNGSSSSSVKLLNVTMSGGGGTNCNCTGNCVTNCGP